MNRLVRAVASRQLIALLLIVMALLPVSPVATGVTAATRQPLAGHVPGNLAQMTRLGPLAPDQRLTLTIALRPRGADGLARAASTPGAHLGVGEIAARFGQSDAAIQSLANYLASYGLKVGAVSPDHLSFQAEGTVSEIEGALSVNLANYVDAQGRHVYATSTDPQLPVALAGSVQAIFGLENVNQLHEFNQRIPPQVRSDAGSQPGNYTPADMQAAYDVGPLYTQGLNGAGQTIGIIGFDTFLSSDIQTFSNLYGLPSPSISVVNVDGGANGNSSETTMDLEWSHAIAPGAALRYYGFSNGSFSGFLNAVIAVTNENKAKVVSISLGACESIYAQTSYLGAMENQFQVAAAEGISVLVSSGDSGAYCSDGKTIDVSYPASSAYVTAVGGTSLTLNSNGGYGSETAWGYYYTPPGQSSQPWGSGGGYSGHIAEPSWQSQAGISDSTGKRAVPDVALNADPITGNCLVVNGGVQCGWGGTSIASPEWAGLIAIANQAAGKSFGLLGPTLYSSSIRGLQGGPNAAYHDVTTGNNLKYNATTGWDAATGWGSPNGCKLVRALVSPVQGSAVTPAISGTYQVYLPFVVNGAGGITC